MVDVVASPEVIVPFVEPGSAPSVQWRKAGGGSWHPAMLEPPRSYLLYLSLLPVLSYMAAYAVSYIAGIVVSYLLNAVFVFRQSLSCTHLARFPMVYVVLYVIGSGILWVLVDGGGVRRELAMIVVIAVSVPLTFVLSRYVLKRGTKG